VLGKSSPLVKRIIVPISHPTATMTLHSSGAGTTTK
jgi:hypothetical protein